MKEQNTTDQLQQLLQELRDKKVSKTVALEMIRQLKKTGNYARQTIKTPAVVLAPANGNGHKHTAPVVFTDEKETIIEQIKRTLAEVMILDPADIDTEQRFIDMGVDSIVGVEWVRILNREFSVNMPATRLYDYPSIAALAVFIASETKIVTSSQPVVLTAPVEPISLHVPDLETALKDSLSEVLYLDAAQLDSDAKFTDIGVDSIIGVEWVRTINRLFGLNITATRLYDYPSIRELASYLRTLTAPTPVPEKIKPRTVVVERLPEAYGLVLASVQTLDEISLQSWTVPPPGEWEVTIKVMASAINFPDTMCIKGLYPTMPEYPFVPGFEAAGIVSAVGTKVTQWKSGDEVIVTGGQQLGCHASYVNVPVVGVVRKPANWSFEEACSIPVAFTTVYNAFERAALKASDSVLIQTATGGCGLMALQLASLTGSEIYGTSSRQEKIDMLTQLGVQGLNYKGDFDVDLKRIRGGLDVDVVLNMLAGGAIQKGLNVLASGGRYLELAVHGLKTSNALDFSHLLDNQVFYSIDMRRLGAADPVRIIRYMEQMVNMAVAGDIVPIVSRIYPVSQITEALRYVEEGAHIGKVVISHTATAMEDRSTQLLQVMKAQMQQHSYPGLFSGQPVVKPVKEESIAIIGVSGQFPQSPTLEAFWNNLKEGRNCVTEVGRDRWSVTDFYSPDLEAEGKTNSKWMGVLEDADKFDPLFFNISPAEAVLMDPQQRLFLENCWHSIENAGISPASLAGSRCGVFAGCAVGDYGVGSDQLNAQGLMGGASSILSARISYLLDLKGPCMAIETACSSTLVAIATACDSLLLGRSDLALAGGVCVMAGPYMHIMTSKAGMLSPTGRCYSFDDRADGFVPGEGAGVFLLKRLTDAERDGDHIHGVIRAWGVNQDGKTNGITAPSVRSQQGLEQDVYEQFRIDPATITMLEAHGTGTPLGDPIEVEALAGAFKQYTQQTGFCALGAVKSNVGHLMNAAGAAGLMKILLSLRHKAIPPTIHFEKLNEHITLDGSPFYINTSLQPWNPPAGVPRRAAISAFGFSGTNAHLVIDEYNQPVKTVPPDALGSLFLLSAKNEERLRAYAQSLYGHVLPLEDAVLASLAYTLQTGRDAMLHRVAFLATDKKQLLLVLQDFIQGKPNTAYIVAQVKKGREGFSGLGEDEDVQSLVQNWLRKRKLSRIADLWVKGLSVDWDLLYGHTKPSRVPAPGYPFARERYWLNNLPLSTVNTPAYNVLQPVWTAAPVVANGVKTFDRHWVLLCGIQEDAVQWLKAQLPGVYIDVMQPHADYIASSYSMHATMIFEQLQVFLQNRSNTKMLVQVIIADKSGHHIYEGLAGLLKTAALENPRVKGQVITVNDLTKELLLQVVSENITAADISIRYNNQQRLIQDWQPAAVKHTIPVWHPGGVYLLTGGLGGLALLFAREILQQEPSAILILVGRSELKGEKVQQLQQLLEHGAKVEYYQADCSQREAVAELLQYIIGKYGTLNGILHSAGQIKDNYIIRKAVEEFESVLSPKLHGVQYIDELSKDLPLDWFISFGSVAGVSGNAGQADYAVANAFMDAYMHHRNTLVKAGQRSGISLSIDWPLWKEGGMKVDVVAEQAMAQAGIPSLDTPSGIAAFYQAVSSELPQVMVIGQAAEKTAAIQPIESQAVPMVKAVTQKVLSADQLKQTTLQLLKELLSEHIQLSASAIDEEEAFETYGIDSIMINRLNQRLAHVFGTISRTLFFEYQTLRTLAGYLSENYADACQQWAGVTQEKEEVLFLPPVIQAANATIPVPIQPPSSGERDAIAIVGISGRYPQAANIHAFWDNLRSGKDAITEIPGDRWSLDGFWVPEIEVAIEQGKSYGKWGGFLDNHTAFDAAFFNISPREALSIDPQERLFLEVCWEALEDAGYTRKLLLEQFRQRVGVFAGITKTGFDLYGPALWEQGEKIFPHTSFSSVANRISYFLNIQGPSLPIDTMCSSSLTAIHEASEYLLRGDCEVAIAGGVNLYLHPSSFVSLSAHRMLSADGRSKSFGAGGDGFAPGEGVGAVILKRLEDAERDGDHIYALIRSTGINHGGKTNGYTVPNPGAQSSLIRDTLDKAGLDARKVTYVEAHGTGTALGDPIEVTGLTQAYEKDTNDKQYCSLGAVKSNIGHLEAAAGIAGLTKIVLQLKHRQLAPSLYAGVTNPNITFNTTPFAVQQELTAWDRPVLTVNGKEQEHPRTAGLSSFGAGGANAHIIVEEYKRKPREIQADSVLIVLSAHEADRLELMPQRLLSFIQQEKYTDKHLAAIAWTLQTGREPMEERLAFTVASIEELRSRLEALTKGDYTSVIRGKAQKRKQDETNSLPDWLANQELENIATAWVNGAAITWEQLYPSGRPVRVSLPAYPFRQDRYWLPALVAPALQQMKPLAAAATEPVKVQLGNITLQPLTTTIEPLTDTRPDPQEEKITVSIESVPVSNIPATVSVNTSYSLSAIQDVLINTLADVLLMQPGNVQQDKSFLDMGLDSIVGVEWMRIVNRQFNINVPATRVYDYPTIEELATFLSEELKKTGHVPPVVTNEEKPVQTVSAKAPSISREYTVTPASSYGLVVSGVHTLDEVAVREWHVPPPAAGEVTVQVKASAVNFPDTLCVKGLYPTIPDYPFVPGFEVAGVITVLGEGVTAFKVGDKIIATTGQQLGGHAGYVNVAAAHTVRMPGNWTFEEACSLPVVFSTVMYAFELGRLSTREKVLIHTATGGCGLAALQLASLKDCEIYATAGKEHKLDLLRQLGVKHALSYKGNFDKEIRQLTNGEGVQVVLNMLSGDAIQKGLNVLANGGRYLELAVHGLKTSARLDLSSMLANQSFYSIDLRRTGTGGDPQQGKALLDSIVVMAEAGLIVPVVSRIYPLDRIAEALAYVDKGEHIGKVVISHVATEIHDLTTSCITRLKQQRSKRMPGGSKPVVKDTKTVAAETPVANEGIAIVGMSGQFPQSPTLDIYWDNLRNGKDCVTEVPANRWPVDRYYDKDPKAPGKSNSKWMGVLEDADKFDPLFFNISPAEAELMDPQQRVFLENCWHCVEHAGIAPSSLWGARCGVFVGCATGDYGADDDNLNAQGLMGGSISILSARISYLLNLKGPCLAIETACSSSLVAIAAACDNLLLHRCDSALAGGVCILPTPLTHVMTSKAGMLSSTGHCYTFDSRADGFVPGEGAGVVMLKRLSDAERDGDQIYGVIRGWGVNQDGKTNGITAPSMKSQVQLEQEVYDRFLIDPSTISLLEAHGTGTQLGDPIEVEALINAFKKYTDRQGYCAIGAVKSNIGHLLTAAGAASIMKVLLALQHKQLPPTINFNELNEHISLQGSPFYVNAELRPWEAIPGTPRRAAISAFGFSGTNAHFVIEEYPSKKVSHDTSSPVLIILSAKSEERLKAYASCLRAAITTDTDLVAVAWTLQTGRDAMEYRLAFIANDAAELSAHLSAFIEGKANAALYTGSVKKSREKDALLDTTDDDMASLVESWISKRKWDKIAALWVKGHVVNWKQLYDIQPSRIALPGYPFLRESYWLKSDHPPVKISSNEGVYVFEEYRQPVGPVAGEQLFFPLLVVLTEHETIQEEISSWLELAAPGTDVVLIGKETDPEDYLNRFLQIETSLGAINGILYLGSSDDGLDKIVPLMQVLPQLTTAPQQVMLAGYEDGDTYQDVYLNACAGFERSLKFVLPETKIVIASGATTTASLMEHFYNREAVSISWENEATTTKRIRKVAVSEQPTILKSGATYLITGGAGGLGYKVAAYIADHYTVNLILTGRSPLDAAKEKLLADLNARGSRAVYLSCDIADEQEVRAMSIVIEDEFGTLNGIIHAAGIADGRLLHQKSAAAFRDVLRPKVEGSLLLDNIFAEAPLDFVCYFSSSAAILGDFGSCDYAVGNSFQQHYAAFRRGAGLPGHTVVINWPLWRDGGMHLNGDASTTLYLQSSGQRLLETTEGLSLFEKLLSAGDGQYLVLAGELPRLERFLGISSDAETTVVKTQRAVKLINTVVFEVGDIEKLLETDLKRHISQLLKIPAEKLDAEENLAGFGFDSISLSALAQELSSYFHVNITPALFFAHASIGAVVKYLAASHTPVLKAFYQPAPEKTAPKLFKAPGRQTEKVAPAPQGKKTIQSSTAPLTDEPIAIIGMSGRFPQSRNVGELWDLLKTGKAGVTEVPEDRFDWRTFYGDPLKEPGKTNSKWCGFVPGVKEFDAAFFEISPKEAKTIDPRQRLLLQEAWNALEDAGYGETKVKTSRIGMYVGVEEGDYGLVGGERGSITATHNGVLAARLGYFLNFRGPVMAINTACSSSLVALHQACVSLRNSECDTAIVAGVNLMLSPEGFIGMGQAGMLSPDGTCYAFDKRANGLVPGEAVAVVVLKPLSKAVADADPIYAQITGSGINYDGKSNGITAPNGAAQSALISHVYQRHHINAADIGYVVTHGTGTRLGDPVEIQALDEVFKRYGRKGQYCALTSAKSSLGHSFAASGLVSLVSLVKSVGEGIIPGSLHCEEQSDYVDWTNSSFYVNTTTRPWPEGPRTGAVSAFGMSGTNAHVVVKGYEQIAPPTRTYPAYLIVLSAKTANALQERVNGLLTWLHTEEGLSADIAALAATLQTGRYHFRHRYAFVAESLTGIREALSQILTGTPGKGVFKGVLEGVFSPNPVFADDVVQLQESLVKQAENAVLFTNTLTRLAAFFSQGYEIGWAYLYNGTLPTSIHLPGYPFAKDEYWPAMAQKKVVQEPESIVIRETVATTVTKEALPVLPLITPLSEEQIIPAKPGGIVLNSFTEAIVTPVVSAPVVIEEVITTTTQTVITPVPMAVKEVDKVQVEAELTASLAEALCMDEYSIEKDKKFIEMGLDSIVGVEWIRAVNKQYGLNITATKVYDYPTLQEFAGFIATQLAVVSDIGSEPSAGVIPVVPVTPVRQEAAVVEVRSHPQPVGREYGLVISGVQQLEELSVGPWKVPPPAADEITIAVMASAVNFPDTMCVRGLYPTMPPYPYVPGFEVAGVVVATGTGVTGIKPGDEVIALAGKQLGCHASHVNVPAANAVRKPVKWTFEEACSLPVVFSTVYYAFELGQLSEGEKVLIQTATGGCGLVAIQLAQLKGCEIFGTSSRSEKLEILRRLGVRHALNYKGDFDKEIRALTNGTGVDIVLNMLSGDAIQKGINCLGAGGRYLELAIHGLKTSAPLDLSRLLANQAFFSVDLRQLGFRHGFAGSRLLDVMVEMADAGQIVPIVSRIYPVSRIVEALQYVDKGGHIGKVVISHRSEEIKDLTDHCIEQMIEHKYRHMGRPVRKSAAATNSHQSPVTQLPVTSSLTQGIAIIGMSGQFPQSPDLDTYWKNLRDGKDCVTEVPASRWPVDIFYDPDPKAEGKSTSKWMGVLEDADKFDPLFFNISPAEAEMMDPQQRLFLENSWHCIEHAGIRPGALSGSRCGVFVGVATGDYGQLLGSDGLNAQGLMGGATSILSARISYLLNLNGPSLAIETACSSALVAIADACNNLVLGNADMALAGGVNVIAAPFMHVLTSKAGMLSSTGHCYTFDNRADGFVPGEGVGVVLLKRLADAERDGDQIYGVIRGWGVNQDGKTNGITAPSVKSQRMLQEEVYEKFGIDPATITMLEAHGTGTQLGDPIEVEALVAAFSKYTRQQGYCALGSVKSNIGHLLTAAGASSIIKVLLSMQHKQLPPTINFESLNEHIRLDRSPFFINKELQPWNTNGTPRRAAISSFGFSGTNAHLVIEEYTAAARPVQLPPAILSSFIVLSARTEERLQAYAQLLRDHLTANEDIALHELAYTLQTGRDAMPYRLAITANNITQLLSVLDEYLSGKKSSHWVIGQVSRNNNAVVWPDEEDDINGLVVNWLEKGKFRKVATLWTSGLSIDFDILYKDIKVSRIALPVYPFARERYWIEQALTVPSAIPVGAETTLPVETHLLIPVKQSIKTVAAPAYGKHLVVLCEVPENLQLPSGNIVWHRLHSTADNINHRYEQYALAVFKLLKELLQEKNSNKVLVQLLYPSDASIYSGLHGLLRSAGLENPRISIQTITLDSWQDDLQAIVSKAAATDAIEINTTDAWTSKDWTSITATDAAPVWKQHGVYLITGGAGGLGLLFAAEIVRQVQPVTLILTGRSLLDEDKLAAIRQLKQAGAIVEYRQTDIAHSDSVAALLRDIRTQYGQLNGILHSAGEKRDNYIIRKPESAFLSVLAAKVHGTTWLDEASSDMSLDFFVTFSSVAASFGNTGQADYATGNAFMDAYMHHRKQLVKQGKRSGKSLSVNWPLWASGGMQVDVATLEQMQQSGLVPLETSEGVAALYKALSLDVANVMVLRKQVKPAPVVTLPKQLTTVSVHSQLSGQDLSAAVLRNMKQLLASHIRLAAERIDAHEPFESYGIDSIMITRLNRDLEAVFGNISRTLFFEYQTLHELSSYLTTAYPDDCNNWIGGSISPESAPVATANHVQQAVPVREVAPPTGNHLRGAIAIIGLSGRYPDAATLTDFWSNLREGKESIREIPADRWSLEDFYVSDPERAAREGKSYSKWGAFLKDFAAFDAGFFQLSPREVIGMDPQERLFLEICWEALEDAGYTRKLLQEKHQRQVGVFAGITKTGFELYGPALWEQGQAIFPSTSFSSVANRISYLLNLQGPSMPVDTMCSSSLTAIHEACEYLLRGDCEMAIAGGVNLYTHPSSYIRLSAYGMLSVDGHCRSFGAGGNGFVPGEGAGAIIIKRLEDAERDGDHIYGVIRSSGINHGGRTNGYAVPSPVAQGALIRKTLDKAGIHARALTYIEAHGTGTTLGDPIEVTGLTQAFNKDTSDTQYCALGAVKSNIGHLEAAAGIAGLTKILLQLQHGQLVPSLHTDEQNPNIRFDQTPFKVQQTLSTWDRPLLNGVEYPRMAGLSSFGAGGSNAHLIIEEYINKPVVSAKENHPVVIVLSAVNEERLAVLVKRLDTFLDTAGYNDNDLSAIAYTLQTGREAMETRIAFVADSFPSLRSRLQAWQQGDMNSIHQGKVVKGTYSSAEGGTSTLSFTSNDDYEKIAASWVTGILPDWQLLYQTPPRRISLPAYPFARDRYWPGDLLKKAEKKVSTPVHIFEETWIPAQAATGGRIAIPTLLCYITNEQLRLQLTDWIKAQGLTTQLLFITPDQVIPSDQPIDAVLYYADASANADSYTDILLLLQQLSASRLTPARIVLAGKVTEEDDSRSFIDSWIGFEQSLSFASKSRVVVAGLQRTDISRLFDLLYAGKAETTFFEDNNAFIRKVQSAKIEEAPSLLRTGGTYLITGGTGGLGYHVATYLAEKYKARLVLTGRSALDSIHKEKINALSQLGGSVIYVQADCSNESDLYRLSRKINNQFGNIQGIIHAAGLNNALPLSEQTATHFQHILSPKVEGTLLLDKTFANEPLDFVCYFSSIAAQLGDFGGCSYAVANRFQTAYARKRKTAGKSIVINWPLWREGVMQLDEENTTRYLQQSGQRLLETVEGIQLMEQLLSQAAGQYIVLAGQREPLHQLLGIATSPVHTAKNIHSEEEIVVAIKAAISRILLTDPQQLHLHTHLADMGFDSISLAALAKELSSQLGATLTTATFFTYPTIHELSQFLLPAASKEAALNDLLARVKDGSLDIDQADKLLYQL